MNNKTDINTILRVARWEFNRFFKILDTLKAILWIVGFGVFGGFIGFWLTTDTIRVQDVAVHSFGSLDPATLEGEGFRFDDASAVPLDSLLTDLDAGRLDAVLSVDGADDARLWIRSSRGWVPQLRQLLGEQRREVQIDRLGLERAALEELDAGMQLETILRDQSARSSTADRFVAGYAIFLVLMAVFLGFAHLFTGITGEKQQRITEQVVSAITPQVWMDGKILGISAVGIVNVMIYALLGLVAYAGFMMVFGDAGLFTAILLVNPVTLLIYFLVALLGILMWNAFLAAVAATIDNPNTSERSGLMMFPTLPVMFAFFSLYNPESLSIRVLSMFPITSPAVLPARMVQASVPAWEIVLAIVLLGATIWLFRRLAGKVFTTGMMMYGKEPSLREIVYWMRKA